MGLISIDSYRVGGTEQLQRYADLMGVPMRTAKCERELREALLGFADEELVLIDLALIHIPEPTRPISIP